MATPKDYSKEGLPEMPKVAGLVRQGSRYSYRRGVPHALRDLLRKREVWITLNTADYVVAGRLARKAAVKTDALFDRARKALAAGMPLARDHAGLEVGEAELQNIAIRDLWKRESIAGRTSAVPAGVDRQEWTRELDEELANYETADEGALALLARRAIEVANAEGLKLKFPKAGSKVPDTLSRLIEFLRRSDIESLRRAIDRVEGGHGDLAHDPLFVGVSSLSSPQSLAKVKPVTLGEAIERFNTDPTRAHLGATADAKFVVTFRAMREVIGDARPLADIGRSECALVQEIIAGLPVNVRKKKAYARLGTLREVVALAASRKEPLIALGTVRVYTHTLSAFFNWAIKKGLLSLNPATRMAPSKAASEVSRRPFTIDELNKIVAALPAWSSQREPFGRKWVPLIALFSGMRLGEIVTLGTDDVAVVDGVDAFVLRQTAGRSLKTAGSERVVPIHPELVRLGLMSHIAAMRSAGKARLFPDLPGANQKQVAATFQKRFSYFQKMTLKNDKGGVMFHSFRHGFRDALREAGVPIDSTRALGGWARSGGVEERYGQGTRAATLAKWLATVGYPGLKLDMLA